MSTVRRLVITGSSSGIGRVLAEHFAGAGWSVWGWARREQAGLDSGGFRSSVCNVADWDAVRTASEEIARAWSHIDALICCAGVQGAIGPAMSLEPGEWSATVRLNLDGTFHAIRGLFSLLKRATLRAKIVCLSGGGATGPRPNFSAYAVAKTGVTRLVETLAHEWQSLPIDINAMAPGALPTRLTEETLALGPERVGAAEFALAQRTAAAGAAGFAKVCSLAEFLLSSASDGISGRLISAPWDDWTQLVARRDRLGSSDVYTLRRIVPEDRPGKW